MKFDNSREQFDERHTVNASLSDPTKCSKLNGTSEIGVVYSSGNGDFKSDYEAYQRCARISEQSKRSSNQQSSIGEKETKPDSQ